MCRGSTLNIFSTGKACERLLECRWDQLQQKYPCQMMDHTQVTIKLGQFLELKHTHTHIDRKLCFHTLLLSRQHSLGSLLRLLVVPRSDFGFLCCSSFMPLQEAMCEVGRGHNLLCVG